VTALVAAEYLKFRTTRTAIGVLLAALALVAVATAGTVGTAEDGALGTTQLTQDTVSSALFASLVAFIVGILSVTVEWRHGTVTRTFLVTPRRARVLVAKEIWMAIFSAALATVGLLLVLAIASPWLELRDSSLVLDRDAGSLGGRIVLATVLWGALGVGIGAVVQSQTPALVGAILWILLVEALIGALLGLVDLEGVADYLPGRALSSFGGTVEDGGLSRAVGGAVGLAWVVGLGALGWLRMSRQDVT
jgi:ABC-2 type transport system permease protein